MKNYIYFLLVITILASCTNKPIKKAALYFKAVPAKESGIDFSNNLSGFGNLNIIDYLYYYNGGGVAVGDINNDGLDDIFFTANELPDRLYLNLGHLKFKDITKSAGIIIDNSWSTGVTMADVNSDGFLDIYVSKLGNLKINGSHNQLYLNNGDNTFTESSQEYGIDFTGFSTQSTFFDYDQDGDLDMYLMNHSVHAIKNYGKADKRNETDSLSGDILFENKMNEPVHKFVNVSKKAGIYNSSLGFGLGLIASDINQDGLIDIYVGNDFHENDYLYINQGNKTFKESSEKYFSHTSLSTMGVDIADLNNDHLFDIFTLDMMPDNPDIMLKSGGEDMNRVSQIKKNFGFADQYAHNNFHLNRDNTSFSELAFFTDTYATDWSWSVLLQDFDNDGLNDIFISNGIYKRPNDLDYISFLNHQNIPKNPTKAESDAFKKKLIAKMPSHKKANIIFKNKGNLKFEKSSIASGFEKGFSNGAAYSDFDNDGDLDLVVNNLNQKASILENVSQGLKTNSYVTINLKGSKKYPIKIGSKIIVYCGESHFVKELTTTKGFESASSYQMHFGLGTIKTIDSVRVVWPDGFEQTEKQIKINQKNTIDRLDSETVKLQLVAANINHGYQAFPFVHRENTFYDYEKEILIPEELSTEGPAVVYADFNNDGLKDIYLGGARYQASRLFFKQKNGSYQSPKIDVFERDSFYEDVDAINFDIDNDGDQDLYVVSGGNDKLERDKNLMDRIYINDGKGHFKRLKLPLFMTNGGSVSTADFDQDGYPDLFIGSRSIPSGYGLSPYSFILRNNHKNSFEIVKKLRIGMVTDSQWADLNGDKLPDLVLAGDWMPISVLINNGDKSFTNKTSNMGLDKTNGLWNTIKVVDVDNNGTLDILGGNAGLNFKWKASKKQPVKMYLDDFDSNGQLDPIIFYNYFGHQIPFATRDMIIAQIPSLKKRIPTNQKYTKINNIKELTGKSEKDILEIKEIDELRSMIYYNTNGVFKGKPLPNKAQLSSIEDFYIDNTPKNTSLMFFGNHNNGVTSLGDNNANSGGVFLTYKNNNFGNFKYLPLLAHINGRKLVSLGNNLFLAVSNNDSAYLFYKPTDK